MSKFTTKRRIEILIDQPLFRRLRIIAEREGVGEYTLIRAIGGQTERGHWRDDQVTGGAGSKIVFVTYLDDETADRFLDALIPVMEEYGLTIYDSVARMFSSQ